MSHQRRRPARDVSSNTHRQASLAQMRSRAVSPVAIASTSGSITRARASPVGSSSVCRCPTPTPPTPGTSSTRGASRSSAFTVSSAAARRRPRLDLGVPHLAQGVTGGIQALEPRVPAAGSGLRLGADRRLVCEPARREERDRVVDRGQVLLRDAVAPVELLAVDEVRERLEVGRVGVAERHGEGGGGRVNDLHVGL